MRLVAPRRKPRPSRLWKASTRGLGLGFRRGTAVAVLLLHAACNQQPKQTAAAPSSADASASSRAAFGLPGGQVGLWEVAAVNGRAVPPEHHPIYLLNGSSGGEAQSQCIPYAFVWPGHERNPAPPRPAKPGPAPVVCARGLTPVEKALGPALASVQRIGAADGAMLFLEGEHGSVTLRRPAEPALNPFGNSPGPGPTVMWGEWRVAAVNGRAPDTAMTLLFFRERLELVSGCVTIGRLVEQLGPSLSLSADPGVTTRCERMTSPDELAAERILAGDLRLEGAQPRRRTLSGPAGSITLVR